MSDQADRPLVDNDTVLAFLDGDGADPEAFEDLRRRITLAVPYILDSEVGREYAVAKLAEAEKRGAVMSLREFADLHDRGLAQDARSLATVYEKRAR